MARISTLPAADRDEMVTVEPWPDGIKSLARMLVWTDLHLVIFVEVAENSGPSVTNSIEALARHAERHLGIRLDTDGWRLMEHYTRSSYEPNRLTNFKPTLDEVVFEGYRDPVDYHQTQPRWYPVDDDEAQAIFTALSPTCG